MNRFGISFLALVCLGVSTVYAGLTTPSTVIWGEVRINGQLATAPSGSETPVRVVARLGGHELASYSLGDRSPLENRYAVTIPMESLEDGSSADLSKARIGEMITLVVIYDDNGALTEELSGSHVISSLGQVVNQDLFVGLGCAGDLSPDGDVNAQDLEVMVQCLAGPEILTPPGGCSQDQFSSSDLDNNTAIDMYDVAILQRLAGPCP